MASIILSVSDTSLLVTKITFVMAKIIFQVALIFPSEAEITVKVTVMTSAKAKITFVVGEMIFKVAVITSSVVKITVLWLR